MSKARTGQGIKRKKFPRENEFCENDHAGLKAKTSYRDTSDLPAARLCMYLKLLERAPCN